MLTPYPLFLVPFFRDYLWGGRKLQTALGKNLPTDGLWAESWEIVDHPEHSSEIANGPLAGSTLRQLCQMHPNWLLGKSSSHGSLPLLLKYLDCQRVLSVQVHPDDRYAQKMSPPDLGKTEAWVILAAEPESVLYAGLVEGVTRDDLRAALDAGQVEQCLHRIFPQAGDCVFIPAGTVHALGAGLLVAEIQQASNTTFRLCDWNRLDALGKPRTLHVEQSLEVIDFQSGPRQIQVAQPIFAEPRTLAPVAQALRERLVQCDKFVLDRWRSSAIMSTTKIGKDVSIREGIASEAQGTPSNLIKSLGGDGYCHLVTIPTGEASLTWGETHAMTERLTTGQSLLLPAVMPSVTVQLQSDTTLLDMWAP